MKTQEEIEALKERWLEDPCWDIECTEGFEDHAEELKEFSTKSEFYWRKEAKSLFKEFADACDLDHDLLKHLDRLGIIIKRLRNVSHEINEIKSRLDSLESAS